MLFHEKIKVFYHPVSNRKLQASHHPHRLITLEGIDGSGKDVQSALLIAHLESKKLRVVATREPGGTFVGEQIRPILLNGAEMSPLTELLLLSAARHELICKIIRVAFAKNKWVVCTRFFDSTYAYQGGGRQLPKAIIDSILSLTVQDIIPDVTFLLDISFQQALQRKKNAGVKLDRFEKQGESFYRRVSKCYLKMAREKPDRIVVVDASRSIQEISETVNKTVDNMFFPSSHKSKFDSFTL